MRGERMRVNIRTRVVNICEVLCTCGRSLICAALSGHTAVNFNCAALGGHTAVNFNCAALARYAGGNFHLLGLCKHGEI